MKRTTKKTMVDFGLHRERLENLRERLEEHLRGLEKKKVVVLRLIEHTREYEAVLCYAEQEGMSSFDYETVAKKVHKLGLVQSPAINPDGTVDLGVAVAVMSGEVEE